METLTTTDGLKLALYRWPAPQPARGTVQIVHGLGEHAGRYEWLASQLNGAGWNVVAHDHRGHGRSEGRRARIPDSDALLADLASVIDRFRAAALPGEHVLLGHSMGGAVAARFVAEGLGAAPAPWWRRVDRLVLSSPALAPALRWWQKLALAVAGPLAPDLAVDNGLAPESICRDPAIVDAKRSDPLGHEAITARLGRFIIDAGSAARARAPHWTLPTLLMWAGADRVVAPAGSAQFAAAAPAGVVTAVEWPGLYHEIFNEPERARVAACLLDWLAH